MGRHSHQEKFLPKLIILHLLLTGLNGDANSSTFRVIFGSEERNIDLRLDNKDLQKVAAKSGERVTVPVERISQLAIAEHGVQIVLNCSYLLATSPGASVTWYQLNLVPYNGTPSGSPWFQIVNSGQQMISGPGNSILTIPRTNIVEGAISHGTTKYNCSATSSSGTVRSRATTIFLLGTQPHLDNGACTQSEGGLLRCVVGKNYTQPVILPQAPIIYLSMECKVSDRNPVYPPPTYRWTKDNITIIDNGELTGNFYNLYPELLMINPVPFRIQKENNFVVSLEVFNSSGIDQVPVDCSDHVIYAEWSNYILYSIMGTWNCVVENICGEDTGQLVIQEEDQCSEESVRECGEAAHGCLTVAGEFCCNCTGPDVTYDLLGKNCTFLDDDDDVRNNNNTETCEDVLISQSNRTGITLTIEGGNETFVGSLNCTEGHTAQGFLNCTRNENGSVIVVQHGPLVCVMPPQSYPPCGETCLIIVLVLAAVVVVVIIIIMAILILAKASSWSHIYNPSKAEKQSMEKANSYKLR